MFNPAHKNMLYFFFCFVLLGYVTSDLITSKSSAEPGSTVNASCPDYQTDCGLGCCPFKDATCCMDGFECCQHGQTCIPFIGICVGLVKDSDGIMSLASSKSTPIENIVAVCPPGTTTCAPNKCCKFPQATCCSDGVHCCPHGYSCDLTFQTCVRDSVNSLNPFIYEKTVIPLAKSVKKSPFKSCPGSDKICPRYTKCCIEDNGQWSCCSDASVSKFGMGDGECCDTIFGHMCCPDDYPHCTVFGCTNP